MDETGLFYRDTTKNTYFRKGEDCAGGKRSKERITVALCASMTGEKITPLVIGKSLRPRCFKSLTSDQLPVRYYANKKAWMTTRIMEDWLRHLDRQMKRRKRHILLFLDNAPSHPKNTLNNVKMQFFPPNTTPMSQPMDQGIIQTLKLKYRKRQLQHVLAEMDRQTMKTGPQTLKEITVLQAINWINRSWNETEPSTVMKCFNSSGVSVLNNDVTVISEINEMSESSEAIVLTVDEDDFPLALVKMAKDLFDCDIKDLVNIDGLFATCDTDMSVWDKTAAELLEDDFILSDNEDEHVSENASSVVTMNDATDCIDKLREFALDIRNKCLFQCVMDFDELLVEMRVAKTTKQKTITDFFS